MQATSSANLRSLGSISFNANEPDYKIPILPSEVQNETAQRWFFYNCIIRIAKCLARLPLLCRLPMIHTVSSLFSKVKEFKNSSAKDYSEMQSRTAILGSDKVNALTACQFEQYKRQNPDWFQGENLSVFISKSSDSLQAAEDFVGSSQRVLSNIVTVNYANAVHPGGAAMWGGHGSQEESLFRSNLLYASIDPEANSALRQQIQTVGLHTQRHIPYCGGIYSPDVPTIHSTSKKHNFLSIAACDLRRKHFLLGPLGQHTNPERLVYNNPNGTINWDLVESRTKWMLRTSLIEMVRKNIEHLQSAGCPSDQLKNRRIDTVILGGLGCGAFHNDPKRMAQWIVDVLREPIFKGVFTHWIIPQGTDSQDSSQYYEQGELLDFDTFNDRKLPLQPYLHEAFSYAVKKAAVQ